MKLFFLSNSVHRKGKAAASAATGRSTAPSPKLRPTLSNLSSSSSGSPSSPISVLPSVDVLALPGGPARVTRGEVELLLRRLVGDEAAAALLDGDGMGVLEDAILTGGGAGEDDLRAAFAVFDADGDGKISAEELRGAFAMMGDGECSIEDCRRMICGVDSDGDGLVSFGDFARMMMMPDCRRHRRI